MTRSRTRLLFTLLAALHGLDSALALDFSSDTINAIRTNINSSSTQSWEMGTATEALLEYDHPQYSVFAKTPAFTSSASGLTASSIDDILYFARKALSDRNGTTMIIKDGSAGDPASLGVAVVLGNLTGAGTNIYGLSFEEAAQQEIEYLLTSAPRSSDGAISHRTTEVSLWSDFIYMVPPYLAYYGVVTQNQSLVNEAVNQISIYRNNLLVSNQNLWKHVVQGSFQDLGLWATGNAWAAAGIVRVLATIQNSHFSGNFKDQKSSLTNWALEIHTGFYGLTDSATNLDHNYVNDTSTFLDGASSTLMASTVFRLATLSGKYHYLPHAEAFRTSLIQGNLTNGPSITSDGWVTPVVNPETFSASGSKSPESESFVFLMEAAYRDWTSAGSHGANAGRRKVEMAFAGSGYTGAGVLAAFALMLATLASTSL